MKFTKLATSLAVSAFAATAGFHPAVASMQPETSVVILDEARGETSMNVTNTASRAELLHSSIENLAEDTEELVLITPPVSRVEAGQTQLVRFVMEAREPIRTQRLKRVIFEGIPQRTEGSNTVSVTVRQNLPLIIHPKGLPMEREPWRLLKWSASPRELKVANDSPYVVRLAKSVKLQPQGVDVELPRTYILPGEHFTMEVSDGVAQSVTLQPATIYGYAVEYYDAPVVPDTP